MTRGDSRFSKERIARIKSASKIASSYYSFPLFIIFWAADWIYVPSLKWQFLSFRLGVIPCLILGNYLVQKSKTLIKVELACTLHTLSNAMPITAMILIIGEFGSPYYGGLLLVAVGIGVFIPWTFRFFIIQMVAIFLPFYALGWAKFGFTWDIKVIINTFFVVGIVSIVTIVRYFNEKLSIKEFHQRVSRQRELLSRDRTIKRKAAESLRLERLSSQFSRQVVSKIRDGSLDINKPPHLSEICAVFIDISAYTRGCRRVSPSEVNKIVRKFYKLCIQRIFKYDITFDKTIGDAVLAFSNEPEKHLDYTERVLQCALEIMADIDLNRAEFDSIWLAPFNVKIGIAAGPAEVGFFGDDGSPKTYTALGEVMNLVSRITDEAGAGNIMITGNVAELIREARRPEWAIFETQYAGEKIFAGYEDMPQECFLLSQKITDSRIQTSILNCPNGHGQLHLDQNAKGLFVFRCRLCHHETNGLENQGRQAA